MKRFILMAVLPVLFLTAGCFPAGPDAPPYDVEQAIQQAFGYLGPEIVEEAKRVAWCESKYDVNVVNGQYRGLFQLGNNYNATIDFYGGNPFDPYINAQAARDGYVAYNSWQQWTCKP